jgi:alpha-glucosidase
VYLTPFFPATSTHRYDATSFDCVDPLLGGDAAFASLVRAVKTRGLRLVGDLTLNHTGSEHEWFLAALADGRSVERGF